MSDVTSVLDSIESGDPQGASRLLPLVYDELRRLAASKLAGEAPGQTLQATALVHEAWLKLGAGDEGRRWNGRIHFFAAAAEAMRHILIDNARRKKAIRHGGNLQRENVDDSLLQIAASTASDDDELLAVHDALDRLAAQDARKAEVVKLRYFVGLTIEETAQALGLSEPTVKRDWAYARAWLFREIRKER